MGEARAQPVSRKLTGADLRALGPFLWLDQVQAGDVLLTRGISRGATVVAIASGGSYSHAAIWLPLAGASDGAGATRGRGWSAVNLIESDPLGVGSTLLEVLHLSRDGGPTRLAARLPGVRTAMLLRHPEMAGVPDQTLAAAVDALANSEFYKSYTARERLADAVNLPAGLKPIVRRGLALANPQDVTPGLFCSELVAKFYADLPLPLFDTSAAPAEVSPSRLAAPGSRLFPVTGAVVLPEALGRSAYAEPPAYARPAGLFRETMLPYLVHETHVAAKVSSLAADLEAAVQANRLAQNAEARSAHERVMEQILLYAAGPTLRPGWSRAIRRMLGRGLWIQALDARLAPVEAAGAPKDDLPLHYATLALRELYHRLRLDLQHDFTRTELLLALRLLRNQPRRGRRKRKMLMRNWRALARCHAEARVIVEENSVLKMPQFAPVIVDPRYDAYWTELLAGARADALAALAAVGATEEVAEP